MAKKVLTASIISVSVLLIAGLLLRQSSREEPLVKEMRTIHGTISLQNSREVGVATAIAKGLIGGAGYNTEIRKALPGESPIDSLLSLATDFLITDYSDTLERAGLVLSNPVGDYDEIVWVIREENQLLLKTLNSRLNEIAGSDHIKKIRNDHLKGTYDIGAISRYDKLIRSGASSLGWDWRLLAALIYHESRFHVDAGSGKGAIGLMQIRTQRVSQDSLRDPAVNIAVGTTYLRKLQRLFSPIAADDTECMKFVLAAYNAGEGNILRCIKQARESGVDCSRWKEVASVIPDVRGFRGRETVSYVTNVLDTWADYCRIYPETMP